MKLGLGLELVLIHVAGVPTHTSPTGLPMIMRPCLTPTLTAIMGGNITLSCMARENPTLMFVWIRGGEVVNSGGRVSLQDQGSCLFIFPVALSDAGLYTCNISNVIFGECFSETMPLEGCSE